jgi:hypothetical protein
VRHTDLASFLATLAFGPAQTCRNLTVVPILSADRDPSRVADPRRGAGTRAGGGDGGLRAG